VLSREGVIAAAPPTRSKDGPHGAAIKGRGSDDARVCHTHKRATGGWPNIEREEDEAEELGRGMAARDSDEVLAISPDTRRNGPV